ncbi:MAG TPA: hypothetical protein VKA85_05225 [Candidatus Limnocylindrales bacterium]|nr:hypothetical protein [Candidatus Limnocylindrales bacterium]
MSRYVKYPRGRLYAVLDDPGAASRVVEALVAAGVDAAAIEVLRGDTAADTLDGTGARHGIRARARRAVEFTLMDQAPDIAWYEAALRNGRSVISVRSNDSFLTRRAVEVLRSQGGHFMNHFGRFATEEFDRWRGPEPKLPDYLRR